MNKQSILDITIKWLERFRNTDSHLSKDDWHALKNFANEILTAQEGKFSNQAILDACKEKAFRCNCFTEGDGYEFVIPEKHLEKILTAQEDEICDKLEDVYFGDDNTAQEREK